MRGAEKPAFVYSLLDGEGVVIYVGCTHDLRGRRWQHARDQWWWPDVAGWQVRGPFRSRAAADFQELSLIVELRPIHNKGGLERRQPYTKTELAIAVAHREWRHCFYRGQLVSGSESKAQKALADLNRLRAKREREKRLRLVS